jgi:protein NrfD
LEGIFLWCGIFFGTLLPLVLSYLALRTVAIHSTQSATGLLYVLVISVFMGDLFYKFYSIQYALFL